MEAVKVAAVMREAVVDLLVEVGTIVVDLLVKVMNSQTVAKAAMASVEMAMPAEEQLQ